jgi:hypothetical protein
MWQILFITLLMYSFSAQAREIAIFDTDVCLRSLKVPKNFTLQDLSNKSFNCIEEKQAKTRRVKKMARHGESVLKRLFDLYKNEEKVTVHYFSVFENRVMSRDRIVQAISLLKEKKLDFILFAGGLPYVKDDKSINGLFTSHLILVATGQVGRGIKKETLLWPQNTSSRKIMVGYYKQLKNEPYEKIFATGQLNKKQAYLFLPHKSKKSELEYSSLAVANFAGLALQNCEKVSLNCFEILLKREKIDNQNVRILKEVFLNEI